MALLAFLTVIWHHFTIIKSSFPVSFYTSLRSGFFNHSTSNAVCTTLSFSLGLLH